MKIELSVYQSYLIKQSLEAHLLKLNNVLSYETNKDYLIIIQCMISETEKTIEKIDNELGENYDCKAE